MRQTSPTISYVIFSSDKVSNWLSGFFYFPNMYFCIQKSCRSHAYREGLPKTFGIVH